MKRLTLWNSSIDSIIEESKELMDKWDILRTKPLRVKWNWIKLRWMYTITFYKID